MLRNTIDPMIAHIIENFVDFPKNPDISKENIVFQKNDCLLIKNRMSEITLFRIIEVDK